MNQKKRVKRRKQKPKETKLNNFTKFSVSMRYHSHARTHPKKKTNCWYRDEQTVSFFERRVLQINLTGPFKSPRVREI